MRQTHPARPADDAARLRSGFAISLVAATICLGAIHPLLLAGIAIGAVAAHFVVLPRRHRPAGPWHRQEAARISSAPDTDDRTVVLVRVQRRDSEAPRRSSVR